MLDTDGDGVVTADEMRAQGRGEFITDEEAKKLETSFGVDPALAHNNSEGL